MALILHYFFTICYSTTFVVYYIMPFSSTNQYVQSVTLY